jgi:hypothetical protein
MRKLLSFLGVLFLIFILFVVFMNFGMRRSLNTGHGYFGGRMMQRSSMMGYSYDEAGYMPMYRFQQMTPEEGKEYLKIKEESFKVYSRYGIDINKKQLLLEAELLKDAPDWEKVEDLNNEIASLEAKVKTEIMKINHENTKR